MRLKPLAIFKMMPPRKFVTSNHQLLIVMMKFHKCVEVTAEVRKTVQLPQPLLVETSEQFMAAVSAYRDYSIVYATSWHT